MVSNIAVAPGVYPPATPVRATSVGIITFHFVQNFGAAWQAYALKRVIEKLGNGPVVIDYRPAHVEKGGDLQWTPSVSAWRANAINAYLRVRRARSRMFGCPAQSAAFDEFRKKMLAPTTQTYTSIGNLRNEPPDCSVLICGSDQIWHPSKQFGLDPAYFLDFGTSQQSRISYAASFGRARLSSVQRKNAATWLARLDAISVREASAAELVRDLLGRQCRVLPDPTLLLDDYEEVLDAAGATQLSVEGPYVVSIALRDKEGVELAARKLASTLGIRHVRVLPIRLSPGDDRDTLYPGPFEWLQLIRNAAYVVTNSFHATVFSVLLRRPFFTIALTGKKACFNDRSAHLLSHVRLTERLVAADSPHVVSVASQPIDWEGAHASIRSWRLEAISYLTNAIASANNNG